LIPLFTLSVRTFGTIGRRFESTLAAGSNPFQIQSKCVKKNDTTKWITMNCKLLGEYQRLCLNLLTEWLT